MTRPDPIVEIRADGPGLELERHGAKAVGLQRLLRLGMPVPAGVVIPMTLVRAIARDPTAHAAEVQRAVAALGSGRFAVRSGAAVSMPGALETRLGVALTGVVDAVVEIFDSAGGPLVRATADALGYAPPETTAVIVQALVDAEADRQSGSGAATSRDPVTGQPGSSGSVLWGQFGFDIMSGAATARPLETVAERLPAVHAQIVDDLVRLDAEAGSAVEVEFAIERGRLWYVQLRTFEVAARADAALDPDALVLAHGIAASAGVARGRLHVDIDDALDAADRGEPVVLARTTTSPGDVSAMVRSVAALTARGARESHAAVVARSVGIPAVVGVPDLLIGEDSILIGDLVVRVGDELIVDGTHGVIARPGRGG